MTANERTAILTRPWTVDEALEALDAFDSLDLGTKPQCFAELFSAMRADESVEYAYDEAKELTLRKAASALRLELSARRYVDEWLCSNEMRGIAVHGDGVTVFDGLTEFADATDYPTLARSLGWDGEA